MKFYELFNMLNPDQDEIILIFPNDNNVKNTYSKLMIFQFLIVINKFATRGKED